MAGRYIASSAIIAVVGQLVLLALFVGLGWPAPGAQATAFMLTGALSYEVNRRWVWCRRGASDLLLEIVPFWLIAITGLVISTIAAGLAESKASSYTGSRLLQALAVDGAGVAVIGVLWALKFVLLNRLFALPDPRTASGPRSDRPT